MIDLGPGHVLASGRTRFGRRRMCWTWLAAGFACLWVSGCRTHPARSFRGRPDAHAAAATVRIELDGRLDEAAWASARSVGPFVGPTNSTPGELDQDPRFATTARLLWDADNLYVGFDCLGPSPWNTHTGRDENLYENDVVEVFLDAAGNGRQYAELQASHAGRVADFYHALVSRGQESDADEKAKLQHTHDREWNLSGFAAAGGTVDEPAAHPGWTVEMRIPMAAILKRAGLPPRLRPGQQLRLNLVRYQYVPEEEGERQHRQLTWSPVPRGCPHIKPEAMRTVVLDRSALGRNNPEEEDMQTPGHYRRLHPPEGRAEEERLRIESRIQEVPVDTLLQPLVHESEDGSRMPYRLYVPDKADGPYPLVLYLHHAGQTGSDNRKHIHHDQDPSKADWGTGVFLLEEHQKKHACVVVAPQVPEQQAWAYMSWAKPRSARPSDMNKYMRMTFEIVDRLLDEHPVDRNRIYVTGASMGGFGTFEAVSRRPHFFAAAVPICGGHDEACAPFMIDTPIWAFHGDADDCINVQRSRNMIDAIRRAGGRPRYWEYIDVGHTFVRDLAYDNPEVIAWMFSQTRKKK